MLHYRLPAVIEMMIRTQSSKSRGAPVTSRGNDELELLDSDNAILVLTGKFILFMFWRTKWFSVVVFVRVMTSPQMFYVFNWETIVLCGFFSPSQQDQNWCFISIQCPSWSLRVVTPPLFSPSPSKPIELIEFQEHFCFFSIIEDWQGLKSLNPEKW